MVPGTRAALAEADWASDELRNEPHVTLGCGHLSRPGGSLAGAGFGYCRYHGDRETPVPSQDKPTEAP
jgi:hypothetical protein